MNKLKTYLFTLLTTLTLAVPVLVPTAIAAAAAPAANTCNDISQNIANGANQAASGTTSGPIGCDNTGVNGSTIGSAANSLVKIFSIIVGVVAVVMIIYGGFRYITSGGDSGKVGNAKNSLIYAIVGLVIVALAQLIVHFVLNQSTAITAPAPTPTP